MNTQRIWAVGLLDVAFLMFATVLLVAKGFDRVPQHLRIALPDVAGIDGTLVVDQQSFVVVLHSDGPRVDGSPCTPAALRQRAAAARDAGADQAVIAVASAAVTVDQYLELLAVLRDARFSTIDTPTNRSRR